MYRLIPHVRLLLEPSYGVHGRPEMHYVDGHRNEAGKLGVATRRRVDVNLEFTVVSKDERVLVPVM